MPHVLSFVGSALRTAQVIMSPRNGPQSGPYLSWVSPDHRWETGATSRLWCHMLSAAQAGDGQVDVEDVAGSGSAFDFAGDQF